ncbi:hypothetical protein CLM62_44450 [Streptomyces sp. SA15]|nr:hypothetical protein CLM62_44450 [Streptomyces sp. SA15]
MSRRQVCTGSRTASRTRGTPGRRPRLRFDGSIAGMGTSSGTRLVLGHWQRSPFGPFSDVMIERADGERLFGAPETHPHAGHDDGGAGRVTSFPAGRRGYPGRPCRAPPPERAPRTPGGPNDERPAAGFPARADARRTGGCSWWHVQACGVAGADRRYGRGGGDDAGREG